MATTKTPAAKSAPLKKDTGKATTAVAVRKQHNVVDIQAQLKAQAEAMSERTAPPSGSRIQVTQDKKFKLPNGQVVTELDAVIVDFRTTHNYYKDAFNPNDIQPPLCFAIAVNPKDSRPSKNSPEQQNDSCGTCPMNQFGSDGKGKACKEGRKLALLPPTEDGLDVDHEADMWTLAVSPTAIKGFDGYVQSIARTFAQPPVGFLTTIGFDPNETYAKLVFSNPRPIASIGEAFARQAEAKDMLEAEPDVSGYDANAAKKPAPRKAAGGRR